LLGKKKKKKEEKKEEKRRSFGSCTFTLLLLFFFLQKTQKGGRSWKGELGGEVTQEKLCAERRLTGGCGG